MVISRTNQKCETSRKICMISGLCCRDRLPTVRCNLSWQIWDTAFCDWPQVVFPYTDKRTGAVTYLRTICCCCKTNEQLLQSLLFYNLLIKPILLAMLLYILQQQKNSVVAYFSTLYNVNNVSEKFQIFIWNAAIPFTYGRVTTFFFIIFVSYTVPLTSACSTCQREKV